PDRERLRSCTFVDPDVRSMLARELDQAARALSGVALDPHASHGDFGYGNILVDPGSGVLEGVIDWDTARPLDFPGIDRVNLEIQIRPDGGFGERVSTVWKERAAYDALQGDGGEGRVRALFGLGVARFVLRSLTYPKVYRRQAPGFRRALRWLSRVDAG
ncbi:MAG TPA: phosphotransferase, partial [Longimicrobiales bacterium]|nr:phosphotransferase [Longimicrobiales bacterium]